MLVSSWYISTCQRPFIAEVKEELLDEPGDSDETQVLLAEMELDLLGKLEALSALRRQTLKHSQQAGCCCCRHGCCC